MVFKICSSDVNASVMRLTTSASHLPQFVPDASVTVIKSEQ